jgi:hypothetical protein
VLGVSIAPTGGTAQTITLNTSSTAYPVDLTRLQSDTAFLATTATLPAGTYNLLGVVLPTASVTFCTQTDPTTTGCDAGTVQQFNSNALSNVQITLSTPVVLSTTQSAGLAINIDLSQALSYTGQKVTGINLGGTNVTATSLPSAVNSVPSGSLDFIEDLTGIVTAINGEAVTLQTAAAGTFTATANSSTVFSPNCTTTTIACVQQGQVASIDATLSNNGVLTIAEYDPLNLPAVSGDWIEGIVPLVPTSSTQFELVTNNFVMATSGSVIGASLEYSSPVTVTLANPNPFLVDTKGLTVATSFVGATDTSALKPGQTVAIHVTGFTAATGGAPIAVTADTVILRFTRVAGNIPAAPTPPTFTIQGLPSFFGLNTPALVQTVSSSYSTNYDGVTGPTGLGSGQTVSIRALYFGGTSAPFVAAKVRVP